ncbi:MAG: hypothetical protein NTW79_00660 [Candidatus Berkelbacteria bacterium]|nr:hypothetical protein [Candidatus Berkelbacteria bacterium]
MGEKIGPSEEDLQIREGEPEGRVDDVDLANDRANLSESYREKRNVYLKGHEQYREAHSEHQTSMDTVKKIDDEGGFGKMAKMAEEGELDNELTDKK